MRLAVVSDIHGNLTALEAVIADLKLASPDHFGLHIVFHSPNRSVAVLKYLLSSGYPRAAWLAEVRRHGKYVPPF